MSSTGANAAMRSLRAAFERLNSPDGEDVTGHTAHLTPFAYSAERPGSEIIKDLLADRAKADEFLTTDINCSGQKIIAEAVGLIRCNVLKHRGDDCLQSLDYGGARSQYLQAIACSGGRALESSLGYDRGWHAVEDLQVTIPLAKGRHDGML